MTLLAFAADCHAAVATLLLGTQMHSMQCNVNVEFKVTLCEQVRYTGTLQY